jgi:hypothetical protein
MTYGHGRFGGSLGKGRILNSDDGVQWTEVFKADPFVGSLGYGG